MSVATAKAQRIERRKVIPAMRSAISDGWLPAYRRAVFNAFSMEAREASTIIVAGGELESLVGHWQARQFKVQLPLSVGMAVEGYKLTETEFGKTASINDLIRGKIIEEITAPGASDLPTLGYGDTDALLARKLTPAVEEWLAETTKAMAQTSLNRATRIVLTGREEGLTVGQLSRSLRSTLAAYGTARADMVARSATIWNYNEGAQQVYTDAGVGAKEWLVTVDDVLCEFCRPMQGVQQVTADAFVPGGTAFTGAEGGTLNITGDVQHPPLHPNCRCALIPVL